MPAADNALESLSEATCDLIEDMRLIDRRLGRIISTSWAAVRWSVVSSIVGKLT